MSPVHRPSDFKRIALRATGGKVKAIFWHLGVRCALEERGFTFTTGIGPRADFTPGNINVLIGSSAGSVFSLLVAAGYDVPAILNSFIGRASEVPPIDESTIFRKRRHGMRLTPARKADVVRSTAMNRPNSTTGPPCRAKT